MYTLETIDNVGCVVIDTFVLGDLYGCTDPLACNYDPYRNIDDGSCLLVYTDVQILLHVIITLQKHL